MSQHLEPALEVVCVFMELTVCPVGSVTEGREGVTVYTLQVIVRLLAVSGVGGGQRNSNKLRLLIMVSTFRKLFWFQEIRLKELQQG